MQQTNLFYRWQVLQNLGSYLTLKDLLNTASLSKQYNFMLKKYLRDHYSLSGKSIHNEFQQLKTLFNRRLFLCNKEEKTLSMHPSNVIFRSIDTQEKYTIVQTLDAQYKLVRTANILNNQPLELINLPLKFKIVKITDTGFLYCVVDQTIYRYNLNEDIFAVCEKIEVKGEVQDMLCGNRFMVAIVRIKADEVKLTIFDNNEPLNNLKEAETPFEIISLKIQGNLVMGRFNCYFLFNQKLYELNLKSGNASPFGPLQNKTIVKVISGKYHYMAYERTEQLSSHWSNEEVIKFAQREGFEDEIKIFKAEKVTGKTLLNMDKKYMEDVLGIMNYKVQQKLMLKLEECNTEKPQNYVIHGWGRTSEGALGTHPSKEIIKPIKLKLPEECQILCLSGLYTFIFNTKTKTTLVNSVDQKTNKQEWKEITNKKIWSISAIEEKIIVIASAGKDKIAQRETENIVAEKKDKLRTAKNIIDKITWDPNLNSEQFRVGYLDKFEGVLEIPFSQLEHSQIKDYRVEYFKHNNKVVWDKKKRIDLL